MTAIMADFKKVWELFSIEKGKSKINKRMVIYKASLRAES